MNRSQFNSRLREEVSEYTCSGRRDSAAFLVWYLKNFFRIDKQEALDSVCDSINDKGIDGIYVDENEEEIYLFQSKFSPHNNRDQGDNDIRNFIGSKQWFSDVVSINQLIASTASQELKSLVQNLNIVDKISSGYTVYLQFITNKIFDVNGKEFLDLNQQDLEGFDLDILLSKYTYIADEEIITAPVTINLSNSTKIEYSLSNGLIARVYSIPARELLRLDGIQDRTLFYKNVRYGLGKTRVNKEIKKTILDSTKHENFFLYHNGITIVCNTLEERTNQITISGYNIINGCQSMLTFYENRNSISDNISVLTKIINVNLTAPLVRDITYYANNQNSISLKDLKSDDRVQKDLKRQFFELFNNSVLYKIKPGESEIGYAEVIEIDFAAQLIEAFYLKYPQNTHLKSKLFSERYTDIFSRHIDASKIYLARLVYNIIEENITRLRNEQIRDYGMAKFFFTYLIGEILREDNIGQEILSNPRDYITTHFDVLKNSIQRLWELLTPEINAYIIEFTHQHNDFFDYKNVFKNSTEVDIMCTRIKSDHERILIRHPEDSFSNIYNAFLNPVAPTR